ncbi:MAG TPA: hypothetical protein VFV95_10235 [Vicinamibacterales bacterium]|nr:hypothetical protein [Vicinamibacterales bacterium]
MTPVRISVTAGDGPVYYVGLDAPDGTSTSHQVTVWPSDIQRYAPDATPEELLEASFTFLLEREPKESILARFELPVIERYFPDYPSAVRAILEQSDR